jgi:integrase
MKQTPCQTDKIEWISEGFGLRTRGGKARYIVQYRIGNQQRRMTLGRALSKAQAAKEAKKILGDVARGIDPQAVKQAARTETKVGTAKAVFEGFIAHKKEKAKRGEKGARASTIASTERYLGLAKDKDGKTLGGYAEPLHRLRLNDNKELGRAQIAAVLNAVAKQHGPVAADRCRSALSAAFAWAIGEGSCSIGFHNPVDDTNKQSEQTFKGRALDDAEIKAIWDATEDAEKKEDGKFREGSDFSRIVRLLLLTGARRDEISRLEWSEVKDGMISLPGERTKNHLPFDIPLTAAARDLIGERDNDRIYVFGRYASSEGFSGHSKAKAHLDAKLGGSVKPWRIHDLRHTFSTKLHEEVQVLKPTEDGKKKVLVDVEPHVVEACLNHVSGAAKRGVAGKYNHSKYNPQKRAALEAWAKRLAVITGENVTDMTKHPRKKRA